MLKKRLIPENAKRMYQGQIFSVYQWNQELYDGSTRIFEGIDRADSVRTFGVLSDDRIMLAYDEQPHREPQLQAPGGYIDPGEKPEQAARREFLEETGHQIGELIAWHNYHPFANTNWSVHAYIGRDLKKISAQQLEPGERIEIRTYSFDEFLQLGHEPLVHDSLLRVVLLEALLDRQKRVELRALLYG
jgi:ADP-ribose pyrophosphatase